MTETAHGTFVIVDGVGVLLKGEAATGKSECALALLARGHQLVADDVVILEFDGKQVVGRAPLEFAGLIEIRDLGIFDVRSVFDNEAFAEKSPVHLCIELRTEETHVELRIGLERSRSTMLGVEMPVFPLTVHPGRDLAVLVETAVRLVRTAPDAERRLIEEHDLSLMRASSST